MADRTVTDSAGRAWTCASAPSPKGTTELMGRDVTLSCATESVSGPVHITVGWQWQDMAANGLARLISQASPVPRG